MGKHAYYRNGLCFDYDILNSVRETFAISYRLEMANFKASLNFLTLIILYRLTPQLAKIKCWANIKSPKTR